jgi:NADH-quinone oxidoreductase subunit L
MEGPTPVSALIHAATMVAAGVYLVARMYGFYALSPTALGVIALIGGFTALFAATMAVVKQEIKQVLAYSTISQYGYMMLALGGGAYVAAVFHLTTHAVFKALLFLGAGSVIIAMHHDENMWNMGGLKDEMRVTYLTFLAGSLALAGIFPFAGFWSKDEVLYETLLHGLAGNPLLLVGYAFGLLSVFVTGFYTFRMVLLTFHGNPRSDAARDPVPLRWNTKLPVAVLGIGAATVGFINMAPVEKVTGTHLTFLKDWLKIGTVGEESAFAVLSSEHYHHVLFADYGAGYAAADLSPVIPAVVSLGLALAGVGAAWALYSDPDPSPQTTKLGSVRTLLMNNYYQDEFQVWLAKGVTVPVAQAADTFDQSIVDGVVNGVGSVSLFSGERFRRIQTAVVSNYATLLTLGLTLLLVAFGLVGGWF